MPEPLLLLGLLLPVAALLFLNLRTFRKVDYPHHLLQPEGRKARTAFLFGAFRTHSDILFDAFFALCLAFALSPLPPGAARKAVVVDASASMLAGKPGKRPLDRALERLGSDPALKDIPAFVLGSDPAGGPSRLTRLRPQALGSDPSLAAMGFEASIPFLGLDPRALSSLPSRGYGKVFWLTDRAAFRARGLEAIELAPEEEGLGVYPSRIAWEGEAKVFEVSFAASAEPEDLRLSVYSPAAGSFLALKPEAVEIESFRGGWVFRFQKPGIYRLDIVRRPGEAAVALAFRLLDPGRPAAARGDFSSLVLRAFPLLVPASRPQVLLADLPDPGLSRPAREARGRGGLVLGTWLLDRGSELYLDPGLTGARPILAGLAPRAVSGPGREADLVLSLGPEARANEDLPLAYDGMLQASLPPAFLTSLPLGGKKPRPIDGALFSEDAYGLLPVNPPASEFFLARAAADQRLGPPDRRRWPWAMLMALGAAAKLLANKAFKGRPRRA